MEVQNLVSNSGTRDSGSTDALKHSQIFIIQDNFLSAQRREIVANNVYLYLDSFLYAYDLS